MKTLELNGTLRNDLSRKEVKEIRGAEKVPCVLYGGESQVHFSVPALDFRSLIYTPDVHMVRLNIDGKTYEAILQEVQFHPVNDSIRHVDFLQTFPDKAITMSIPVRLNGNSEGVKMGGKLVHKLRRLKAKALPKNMIDEVQLDISALKIGGSIRVRDLQYDGVTFLDSGANVIVGVAMSRNVSAEAVAAAKDGKK